MKTLAIVQARMKSARLPGKTLADIHGQPMLKWLLDRVGSVRQIDEVLVATTIDVTDDPLASWLETLPNVGCYRGSSEDVLDRFFQASRGREADVIVRLTGDDPLKDPGIVAKTIDVLRESPYVEYASTFVRPTFPEGMECEAMRIGVLERAHRNARLASEREHVTPYIWKNPHLFSIYSIEQERDLSGWRWTVDKPEDLEFVRAVYAQFRDKPLVPYDELVAFIEAHPELIQLNAGTVRYEGYYKSLIRDAK
jgi:spore coat polysaccharide biosynthesis protein SpsF